VPDDQRSGRGFQRDRKKRLTEGEEGAWFRIASRLHLPVSEAKERVSSTEFLRWNSFFDSEHHGRQRIDWLTAILAYQIYIIPFRMFGGKVALELEDFLIRFEKEKPVRQVEEAADAEVLEAARKAYLKEHVTAVASAFGFQLDENLQVAKANNPLDTRNPIQKEIDRQIAERDKKAAEQAKKAG
jgi:hypothetical protein